MRETLCRSFPIDWYLVNLSLFLLRIRSIFILQIYLNVLNGPRAVGFPLLDNFSYTENL